MLHSQKLIGMFLLIHQAEKHQETPVVPHLRAISFVKYQPYGAAYFELEASDSAREQKPPSWPILDILIRNEAAMLTYLTVDVDKVKAQ